MTELLFLGKLPLQVRYHMTTAMLGDDRFRFLRLGARDLSPPPPNAKQRTEDDGTQALCLCFGKEVWSPRNDPRAPVTKSRAFEQHLTLWLHVCLFRASSGSPVCPFAARASSAPSSSGAGVVLAVAVRRGGAGGGGLVGAGRRTGHLVQSRALHRLFQLLGWRFTVLLVTDESGNVVQRDDLCDKM